MNYYPVVIPTLNRYEHFKRCIESLSRCTWAEETEVYVGLDYPPNEKYVDGYNKIKTYLKECGNLRFKHIHTITRDNNWGAVKNSNALMEYVFQSYEAAIFTEDDNEFSPCFLDYMNKALERFEKDIKVSSVSGYSFPRYKGYENFDSYFTYISSAWGMGIWKNKEELIKEQLNKKYITHELLSWRNFGKCYSRYPFVVMFLISMIRRDEIWGDVCRAFLNVTNNTYEVRPSDTLVRNWGDDGSGLHCGAECKNCEQPLNNNTIRNIEKTASVKYFKTCYYQMTDFFSKNIVKTFVKLLLLPYKYFIFRYFRIKECI